MTKRRTQAHSARLAQNPILMANDSKSPTGRIHTDKYKCHWDLGAHITSHPNTTRAPHDTALSKNLFHLIVLAFRLHCSPNLPCKFVVGFGFFSLVRVISMPKEPRLIDKRHIFELFCPRFFSKRSVSVWFVAALFVCLFWPSAGDDTNLRAIT